MTNLQPETQKKPSAVRRLTYALLLLLILIAGAYVRFVGIDWGEYQYLHPDERFLIWVGADIQPVENLAQYFDAANSSLNPENRGHPFYVYGTLPMFITRYLAEWAYERVGFNEMTDMGRTLSALVDWLVILLVYAVARRAYDQRVAILAAAFSAFAVLQIQQSHFFTMDTFVNLFTLLAIYYAVKIVSRKAPAPEPIDLPLAEEPALPGATDPEPAGEALESGDAPLLADTPPAEPPARPNFWRSPDLWLSIAFGFALGCAVASKLNAAPVAMMLPLAFGLRYFKLPVAERTRWMAQILVFLAAGALVSLLAFRIFQPYAFTGPSFFNVKIYQPWLADILEQRNQAAGDLDYPPAMQWARRSLAFSFQNITVWGLGLPLGILAWAGFLWVGWRILRGDWHKHLLLWSWTAAYFLWQSFQFNPTMRYQLPIYPMLAIFAAWALVALYDLGQARVKDAAALENEAPAEGLVSVSQPGRGERFFRPAAVILGALVLVATAAYAFAFSGIYTRPITRVEASYWIYQNIPGPINLHLQTEAGPYNQIISFPSGSFVGPGQPYVATFSAKESGTLNEIYLGGVVDLQTGQSAVLDLVVSQQPDGEKPLSTLVIEPSKPKEEDEPVGQEYSLLLSPAVEVVKDQVYYLYFSVPDTGSTVDVCGPLVVTIQNGSEIYPQQLPQPQQCLIRSGMPYSMSFVALQSGLLTEIYLANVADLSTEAGLQTLDLVVSPTSDDGLFATATLREDFSPDADGKGQGYTLALDRPVDIVAGQNYQFSLVLREGSGAIQVYGSGVANEGDWDDGLPVRVNGYDAYGGIYPNGLNFNMYTDDNLEKRERFLNIYDEADYIIISSNRQWGTLTRLPERHPMTEVHYRHLLGCPDDQTVEWCYRVAQPGMFQGDLGFELVKVFQSDPQIGPLHINTQFAEEAFTVYDHPKVLIFRKTADYSAQRASDILGAADIDHIIRVTPKKAKSYPATLTLPAERLGEQQAGGTWSDYFDTQALQNRVQVVGVIAWYLSVSVLGLLAYPLLRLALPGLPDHGYPLARTAGMLLLAYFTWLAGSLRIPFERLTISVVIALLALTAVFLAYRQRSELRQEWRKRWKYFLVVELLTLAFFLFFLAIRWGNPDLWHQWKGGEKPMDFAYFNAVLKSTSFPPYDPWYAGGYLNYYYYGYVFVGVLVKWLGLVPAFAYNLILPTLFSLTALGAFSIAFNVKMAVPQREPVEPEPPVELAEGEQAASPVPSHRPPLKTPSLRAAVMVGMAAALGMAVLGNLGTVRMILRGYQQLAIPGGLTADTGLFTRIIGTFQGLAKVASGQASLPYGLGDWYWIPSRAIPAPNEVEPITEFPFFTFIYADLHAHMMALPIALLALAWVFSVVLGRGKWPGWLAGGLGFVLGGVAIGALRPTNTWDIFVYIVLAALAVGYTWWRYLAVDENTFGGTILAGLPAWFKRLALTAAGVGLIVGLSLLLYQPYAQWYGLGYSKVELWKGTHTPSTSYLVHWGLFLFLIVSWMAWETRQWMAETPISALSKLKSRLPLLQGALILLVTWVAVLTWYLKISVAWLVLPLATWALILLLRPAQPDGKRLVLFLVGTGLVLTLMVEMIVLRGDIGRMNTVFKFYLQVWTLFAVSAAAALGWLMPYLRTWKPGWRIPWQAALVTLATCAALFTLLGGMAKIRDRMVSTAPHTLDGMAYMQYAGYEEHNAYTDNYDRMDLSQDYNAIRWLQDHVEGSPVIVEANSRNLYRWYSRYTIYTGLPGVVGWEWHQQQQRALNPGDWVTQRVYEVDDFYNTLDAAAARRFLLRYDVRYIVLGQLERTTYYGPGLDKFESYDGRLWQEIYRDRDTVIYEVLP